jgi:catechol 2,3-dioxygenase-like lactoylglutathione lyase family enzyme
VLDHIGLHVADYERSKAFYAEALAPLGLELLMEPVPGIGYGAYVLDPYGNNIEAVCHRPA